MALIIHVRLDEMLPMLQLFAKLYAYYSLIFITFECSNTSRQLVRRVVDVFDCRNNVSSTSLIVVVMSSTCSIVLCSHFSPSERRTVDVIKKKLPYVLWHSTEVKTIYFTAAITYNLWKLKTTTKLKLVHICRAISCNNN